MSYLIKASDVAEIIPMCDDLDFISQYTNRLHPRIVKIIMFRHGHTVYGKISFNDIAPQIHKLDKNKTDSLSSRQISKLYYKGLGRIKELMRNNNVNA